MVHGNRYVSRSRWDNLIYWGQEKNAQVVVFGIFTHLSMK